MPKRGRYERVKPKKKMGAGKVVLIVLLVFASLLIAAVIGGVIYYNSLLGRINQAQVMQREPSDQDQNWVVTVSPEETLPGLPEKQEPGDVAEETKPMTAEDIVNILVVGQSSRQGEEARMADTAILVTINTYTKEVTLSSILRDTFVRYPVYRGGTGGACKFTVAYAQAYSQWDVGGAMEVINLCMEQNFGVEVDYNFEIDFDGFMELVNKMGGVGLELTEGEAEYINDALKGYTEVKAGTNHLDGYMALTYARMRHAKDDATGDIGRTRRQRYLIQQLFGRLKKQDLATINSIVTDIMPYLTTNMSKSEINSLLLDLLPMLTDMTITSGTIPVEGTYWGEYLDIYGTGVPDSILKFDAGQNQKLLRALTEGVPTE